LADTDTDTETDTDSDSDTDPDTPLSDLEIVGSYLDPNSTEHVISTTNWVMDFGMEQYSYALTQCDNDDRDLIAENAAENAGEAGKWSRFDWTYVAGELWYCQTTYLAETEQDAFNEPAADSSAPSQTGCTPYGWLALTPF